MIDQDLRDGRIVVEHDNRMHSGVYFSLPDDVYHRAFALSAHGVHHMRISTLDFWVRCTSLNPEWETIQSREDSEGKRNGTAYDCRIIEGKAPFYKRYAEELDKNDYPTALRTNDEIVSAIAAAGGPTRGLTGKRKEELIAILIQHDPQPLIWETLVRGHLNEHTGKIMLPGETIRRIEIAAAMIENHPELSDAFKYGMPKVAIFWEDQNTGVPMKSQLDYLKENGIVELKSFRNANGLPIRRAIHREVANYRYHIQFKFYIEAATAAKQLISQGLVFGEADQRFLSAFVAAQELKLLTVFQQTGPAPVARGLVMEPGIILDIAQAEINAAKYQFARCWQAFGADPWIDTEKVSAFDKDEFPAYITE